MRKLLVILISTITLPLFAQEVRPARVIKKPEATPTPAPRRSIVDRLFNREKPTPTPAPKPTPAPTPKPKPKVAAKPKPKTPPAEPVAEQPVTAPTAEPARLAEPARVDPPKPAEPAKPTDPTATPPEPPKPETTPETKAEPPKPAETKTKPAKGTKPAAVKAVVAKPEKPDLSNLDEPAKYQAVKELALKDAAIQELKAKADSTIDEAAAKQASLTYNRALFRKIREIEPSLDAYVDRLEQAVLKRVK